MWKVISWSKLLEKHINSVHNGQKDHKCVTCGKQFSQAGTLKKHINSVYKVGHLLSELAIEFASELWCQILLSKVTNKLLEKWCRMHVECGSNPSSDSRWPTLIINWSNNRIRNFEPRTDLKSYLFLKNHYFGCIL